MRGRDLLIFPALAVLFSVGVAPCVQAADKIWCLGVLSLIDSPTMSTTLSELAARGFIEGRNLVVDMRIDSTAMRRAAGTTSRNRSSRLISSSGAVSVTPVTFPPGRAQLSARPAATGSLPIGEATMGIDFVAS